MVIDVKKNQEWEEKPYEPLGHGLFIEESLIDGQGLFASKFIHQNTDLGITHVQFEKDKMSGKILVRTPLGGFINHSANPNCERVKSVAEGTMFTWSLKTVSNVLPGEELTLKYTMYDPT